MTLPSRRESRLIAKRKLARPLAALPNPALCGRTTGPGASSFGWRVFALLLGSPWSLDLANAKPIDG